MKIAHFRKIVEHLDAGEKIGISLKTGPVMTGAWSWFAGPGEVIKIAGVNITLFVEIEEISAITLFREGANS